MKLFFLILFAFGNFYLINSASFVVASEQQQWTNGHKQVSAWLGHYGGGGKGQSFPESEIKFVKIGGNSLFSAETKEKRSPNGSNYNSLKSKSKMKN
eukprot:CAMPEP_0194157314 /NCGR_PEP_ID=MMETSP0152-20130528/71501_1 /TAXON_ID=1049557 /ORGANISM="Thalassiothrix antarctica, Strain L6-D1" /LENGTH=96 /DNA_ID=CAMNT_0038865601 /DNA_START=67 /DNA_END=354 /DNA_ORIENTATION=-